MKLRNSLINKIWICLIAFSISILAFLWFFQVIFLKSYYTIMKQNDIHAIANKVKASYTNSDFEDLTDVLAYKQDVCIDIIRNGKKIYSSGFNRKCINTIESQNLYLKFINEFTNNPSYKNDYIINDNKFDNKILITGVKLDNEYYAFISTALEPLTSTTNILISQLIFVSILVLILSFVIAYFISKKISNPIIDINKKARKMSKRNYDFTFKTDTNILEINELAKTLDETKNELEKTDDLRRELLANVSHDLKTPLTMIKAYAEMVRDITYKYKDKRNNNLNTIIDETDRLTRLVNDILDLSKIESVVEINLEQFDLNNVVLTIIERFKCFKNIEFKYSAKDNLIVIADKQKIEQVIYNLISNAINYVGKDNQVIIKITDLKSTYKVEIIDHGKGIKEEEINNIWDKYYKIDKTHKRNQVGTGLGLSIVKGILENHNFKYGVNSKINKGTTFYFEISKK